MYGAVVLTELAELRMPVVTDLATSCPAFVADVNALLDTAA